MSLSDVLRLVHEEVSHVVIAPALEREDVVQLLRIGLVIVELRPRVVLVPHPRDVVPGIRGSPLVRQHGVQLVKSRGPGPRFETRRVHVHRAAPRFAPRSLLLFLLLELPRGGGGSLGGARGCLRRQSRAWVGSQSFFRVGFLLLDLGHPRGIERRLVLVRAVLVHVEEHGEGDGAEDLSLLAGGVSRIVGSGHLPEEPNHLHVEPRGQLAHAVVPLEYLSAVLALLVQRDAEALGQVVDVDGDVALEVVLPLDLLPGLAQGLILERHLQSEAEEFVYGGNLAAERL
mmetsp:Transcript_12370/g.51993  ORF Transcript_12370/g.51993 Transcript_12370/m.51993 type:complete len:287 (-) Transcript_12370:717-1577(-)